MNLSEHFTLEEMTHTDTGLPNLPPADVGHKLINLCNKVLEPIRAEWGRLKIDSGYRSFEVNAAIGGAITSQHLKGEAADFVPIAADIDIVFDWIVKESGIVFGQCISEYHGAAHWIHISLPRSTSGKNQEALVIRDGVRSVYV